MALERPWRRYPMSKVRSFGCASLERPWGDNPCPRSEKPQQDGRRWSSGCMVLEQLWGNTPCSRAKKKPQNEGRRGEFSFRIKRHSCQRHLEGSNKSCVHQDPGTPQRLRQNCVECLLWRYGSAVDCHRDRGSGCSRLGYGISPLGGGHHYPP